LHSSVEALSKEKVQKLSALMLLTDRHLRLILLICNLLGFANCVLYYGLTLSTPSLGGNRFVNFGIMGVVEIPAIFVAWYSADRLGRRISLCVFHMVAGIPLAIVAFIPATTASGVDLLPAIITLTMIAKFGITTSFALMILYTKELFPTSLRGTGGGISAAFANIGSMLAPFAAYLMKTRFYWAPNVCFAIISVVVGGLVLLLPETAKKPLPDTLEDVHAMFNPEVRKKIGVDANKHMSLN
jgi:nitrate/nitrite transporter NarK